MTQNLDNLSIETETLKIDDLNKKGEDLLGTEVQLTQIQPTEKKLMKVVVAEDAIVEL